MNCPLGKYSDIFGKPNEGAHSYRILDIAIVDVLATGVLASGVAYLINKQFLIVLLCLFILGIILHRLFCINTTINKIIFGKVKKDEYY